MEILFLVGVVLIAFYFPTNVLYKKRRKHESTRERHARLARRLRQTEGLLRTYGKHVQNAAVRMQLQRLIAQARELLNRWPRQWLLDEAESKLNVVEEDLNQKVVPRLQALG